MARTPASTLGALTATGVALVLVVVFASAAIRLAAEELGGALVLVRGVHRVAASAAALVILAVGWFAWRTGERAMAAAVVALTVALSVLGALTGTAPPPAAAAGNLLGGLLLAALLAWLLGRTRRRRGEPLLHAVIALAAAQALLGAWLAIFADELWSLPLLGHATLGIGLAALAAWLAIRASKLPVLALACVVPLAGFTSALLGQPVAASLAHAVAAALLVAVAACAHGRLT